MTVEIPQLYRGAESTDFRPEWAAGTHPELVQLLGACHASDPDELTPLLVMADWLQEHGDPREVWVRVACDLWQQCRELTPTGEPWDYQAAYSALTPVCKTTVGWRLSCLWGHIVAWHAPTTYGVPIGRTWHIRVGAVSRSVWWWALGFCERQASAAWSQASAAGSQVYAAGSQASAAWSQASAAGSQVYAAGRRADVWRVARSVWELCVARLPELVS